MKQRGKYFSLMYLFSYGAIGALFPLIAQYLNKIGFSGTEIGIITSSSTAIGILANSFWGKIYHGKGRNKGIIVLLSVSTALLSLFLMGIKQFWLFLVVYIIVFFFEQPIYPFLDSCVMEVQYPFGKARKWGAIGFATGIGVAGVVADNLGLITVFPMYCIFFLLTGLLFGIYSKSFKESLASGPDLGIRVDLRAGRRVEETAAGTGQTSSTAGRPKGNYKLLFENKKFVALLISAFFFNGPALSHNTYFSFLYLGVGGTLAGMGIVLLLMVISEAPVMAMTDRIKRVIPMEKAIAIAMGISALRFFWYGLSPPVYMLAATFFLQGIANGIALVEMVNYIERLVGTDMLSLALPLFTAISSNSGTIVCQFLGGVIVGRFGGSGTYIFYSLLNGIAVIIYLLAGLQKPLKD